MDFRNTIMFSKNDTALHELPEEVLKFAVLEVCICFFLTDNESIYDLESSLAVTDIFPAWSIKLNSVFNKQIWQNK